MSAKDPALLAAFDAKYPVAEGHKPPDGLDLVWFQKTGHRVGDTPAHRKLMEEGPRRPIPTPPPIPEGVRDPSAQRGGLEESDQASVQAALDLFKGPVPQSCPIMAIDYANAMGNMEGLDFSKPDGVPSSVNPLEVPAVAQPTQPKEKPMSTTETATTAPKPVAGNPFQSAEAIPKRLKLLEYGPPGSGKTTMGIQFPVVALIDMERGADHYAGHYNFDRLPVNSIKDINAAVRWLLTADHEYRTLVLDPITVYWDALQTRWADYFGRVKARGNPEGAEVYTFEPKDYKPMKDEFKEFLRLLCALDMNVIVTAHESDKYSESKFMEKEGKRPDCEKSVAHFFDTVCRMYVDSNGRRLMRFEKDRTNRFKIGQDYPAEYAAFEQCLGADDLGRKATAQALPKPEPVEDPQPVAQAAQASNGGNGNGEATPAQLAKLTRLAKGNQQTLDELLAMQQLPKPTKAQASDLITKMIAGGVKEVW